MKRDSKAETLHSVLAAHFPPVPLVACRLFAHDMRLMREWKGAQMSTDELLKQARALAPAQKLELVEALLNDLDRPDPAVDAAWAAEAQDRLAAYRKGEIRAVPLSEVLAKYRPR
jgi:putative addiction module component (TIGR02574 family)